MANVKENITAQESAYDKDGCIDLILFEEKEHENRIYWMKEKGGQNLVVQDRGDGNWVIDKLPADYVIRGCKYHDNKLMLADGSGKNRNYVRSGHNRLFRRELKEKTPGIIDMYKNTPMRG